MLRELHHCERSNPVAPTAAFQPLDCFASLAMTAETTTRHLDLGAEVRAPLYLIVACTKLPLMVTAGFAPGVLVSALSTRAALPVTV